MSSTSTPSVIATAGYRTVILRGVLVLSLMTAIGVCVSLSYLKLKSTEEQVGLQNFFSVRDSTLLGAKAICARKLQGVDLWATLMSNIMPTLDDWPLVRFDGYLPVSDKLARLTESTTYALMALHDPQQAPAFETHIQEQYRNQGRPEEAGYSDFGFGIWKRSNNTTNPDGRVHDTTGITNWDAPQSGKLMVSLALHNQPAASSLLLNLYSIQNRGIHIDSMLECVERSHNISMSVVPNCTVTTDILQLVVRPGPAGLVFHPIFPADDPTQFVGFATTSLHWEEVLTSVVPSYVTGLRCVISTETQAWTYEIRNGAPQLIGEGDIHDDKFDQYSDSIILNDYETGAATSATYTLTVYPSDEMLNAFRTNAPRAVALGFFGAVTVCALLFFLYDWLMRYENYERLLILEMKRRFVRFISHEIRTPLNTVCMGLELLQGELRSMTKDPNRTQKTKASPDAPLSASSQHSLNGSFSKAIVTKTMGADLELWQTVVSDIHENAYVAVTILNDLLNYDKLETGTMKLEHQPVLIWDLIRRTHGQFRIQATNANLNLQLEIRGPKSSQNMMQEEDVEAAKNCRWCMIGDDVRLAQVFRNIISNALKFTPPDGTVAILAEHVPTGLPNAKLVSIEDTVSDSEYENSRAPERAGSIRIAIKDSGVGMTPDQLKRLFNEGVQFDANRLQHGGGSGLGLSIAKGIVEQHQGRVVAKSDGPGRGTTFVIEFPLYIMSDETLAKTIKMDTTSVEPDTDSASDIVDESPRRVLVAEDAMSSRKMLIRLLERAGHQAVPAANGQVAVDEIRKDIQAQVDDPNHIPIDTVLTDYEMPVLKGPDAAKQMRELGYKGIILGVTGNVLEEDVSFFKEHGANDVLAKPVRMECINAYWQSLRKNTSSTFTRSLQSDPDLLALGQSQREERQQQS